LVRTSLWLVSNLVITTIESEEAMAGALIIVDSIAGVIDRADIYSMMSRVDPLSQRVDQGIA
jgi:hypothetical protein